MRRIEMKSFQGVLESISSVSKIPDFTWNDAGPYLTENALPTDDPVVFHSI